MARCILSETDPRRCKTSLVGQRDCVSPEVVGSISTKTPKIENSNLHVSELHRPSGKGTKLLFRNKKQSSISSSPLGYDEDPLYVYCYLNCFIACLLQPEPGTLQ